jgi:DNA-binding NtrC family response regulator
MKVKINVLIIDDDEIVRDLFLRVLQKRENVKVFVAENGYEGIEILKRNPLHTIFLDLGLPDINGIETFEKIQGLNLNVIVTFMTASSNLSLEEKAKKIPNTQVVYKPLEIEEIYNIIDRNSQ